MSFGRASHWRLLGTVNYQHLNVPVNWLQFEAKLLLQSREEGGFIFVVSGSVG